jgi:phosphate-selective porin OprO/OprP
MLVLELSSRRLRVGRRISVKHHHAQRDSRNGADDLRHDSAGERNPCRSDLVLLSCFFVDRLFDGVCVVHASVNAEAAPLNAAFIPPIPGVNSYVRACLAILLILLAAGPASAQHPSVSAGDWLRVDFTARFQGDLRTSEAPIRGDEDGGLDIARRRVGVEGRVARILDYQAEYELGTHQWRDLYLDYRQFKAVQVRAGMFKLPLGLEQNTSATSLDFIYRTRISARLAPGRDRGVSVHGRVLKSLISYEGGLFSNDGENARPSNSARVFGKTTVAARLLAHPFRRSKSPLADLQFGGAVTRSEVPLGFPAIRARTVFGESFYDSDVWVHGRRQRTGLEVRWRPGRLSIQSEYIRLTDERRGQSVEDGDLSPLVAQGWYISSTYALARKRGRFGRIEAAVRYETLSFSSGNGTQEPSTSARAESVLGNSDRVTTLGINWHLNRWVKVQANVIREEIGLPSMGPMPVNNGFWSRVFRLQLTL